MRRKIIKFFSALLVIGTIIVTQRFCHRQTDGFSLYKISSNLEFHPEWSTPSPKEDLSLDIALSQPYTYLAKGAQSYVFSSADGQYVIKFFRIYHLQPPVWLTHLHWPFFFQGYRLTKILQKKLELEKDFLSYKIAYDHLKEETGLIYLHLNKTDYLHKKLILRDKIGIQHQLDLDQMEFLVQKRATLPYPTLAKIAGEQGLEAAQEALSQLVQLITYRIQKGIQDKDPDLNTNFGFINCKPVQIDVGRFRLEPAIPPPSPLELRDEVIRITDNLNQWLRADYPSLSSHLEQTIQQLASNE